MRELAGMSGNLNYERAFFHCAGLLLAISAGRAIGVPRPVPSGRLRQQAGRSKQRGHGCWDRECTPSSSPLAGGELIPSFPPLFRFRFRIVRVQFCRADPSTSSGRPSPNRFGNKFPKHGNPATHNSQLATSNQTPATSPRPPPSPAGAPCHRPLSAVPG